MAMEPEAENLPLQVHVRVVYLGAVAPLPRPHIYLDEPRLGPRLDPERRLEKRCRLAGPLEGGRVDGGDPSPPVVQGCDPSGDRLGLRPTLVREVQPRSPTGQHPARGGGLTVPN